MMEIFDNAAYVVKRINDIWEKKPGKKALHKMIFLIQQKGVDLGYNYGIHFYGPYSAALDTATMSLGADGIIEFDYTGHSHLMGINERDFVVLPDALSEEQRETVDQLIRHFSHESPSDLELLTTAMYAYDHLEDKSRESVIAGVQKIKGAKYSVEQIQCALENFDYFSKPFHQ